MTERRLARALLPLPLSMAVVTTACASLDGLTGGDGGTARAEASAEAAASDATTARDAHHDAGSDARRDGGNKDGARAPDAPREANAGDAPPCPGGAMLCNGVCVDVGGDVENCGGCDVTCAGTCDLGRCIVMLATEQAAPHEVIVDSTYAYWSDYGAASGNGAIVRVSLAGGTPLTLAPSRLFPGGVAVSATSIYWVQADDSDVDGRVFRMPLDGGAIDTLAMSVSPVEIAIDAHRIYWTTFDVGTAPYGSVLSLGLDGGAPSTLATNQQGLSGLAIDGTNAYWGANASQGSGALMRAPLDGPPDGGGARELVASPAGTPAVVVLDATHVYFTVVSETGAGQTSVLEVAPLDGGPATILVADSTALGGLAMDETSLYWTDDSAGGSIFSRPLDGGATTTLAIGQDQIAHLTVDSTSLYWVAGSGGYGGTIMKLSPK